MSHFEQLLDKNLFVRTHRSYIVNMQQITRIDPYEKDSHIAILKSGGRVSVSKTGYVKLKEVLGNIVLEVQESDSRELTLNS